jgi:starvation-inducible DNA-binding protein
MPEDRGTVTRHGLGLGLERVLADSYTLYNATQVCHWNVAGPRFAALHELFEEQYTELAEAIDEIAERIRALGFYTRGTLRELLAATRIPDAPGLKTTEQMLAHLIDGHQRLIAGLVEIREIAEELGDEATVDLLIGRTRVHEKTIWMLQAQAGEGSEALTATSAGTRSVA